MKYLLALCLLTFMFASSVRDIGKATELVVDAEASFEQQDTSNGSGKFRNGAHGDHSALLQEEEDRNISLQNMNFPPVASSSGESLLQDFTALGAVHGASVLSFLEKFKAGSLSASSHDSAGSSDGTDEKQMNHLSVPTKSTTSDRPIFDWVMAYVHRTLQARAHELTLLLLEIVKRKSGVVALGTAETVKNIHEIHEMLEFAEFFKKLLEFVAKHAEDNGQWREFLTSAKYYFNNNQELRDFFIGTHIHSINGHAVDLINEVQEHFEDVFHWGCDNFGHLDDFIGVHVRWLAVIVTDECLRKVAVDLGKTIHFSIKASALHAPQGNKDQSPGPPGIWERFLLGDTLPPGGVVQYEQKYDGARRLYKTVQFDIMPAILFTFIPIPGGGWFVSKTSKFFQIPELTDHFMDSMLQSCDESAWQTFAMEEKGREDIVELEIQYAMTPDEAWTLEGKVRQGEIRAPTKGGHIISNSRDAIMAAMTSSRPAEWPELGPNEAGI